MTISNLADTPVELTDKQKALKPCPFCGRIDPMMSGPSNDRWFSVHCITCQAHSDLGMSPEEAAAKWNRRASVLTRESQAVELAAHPQWNYCDESFNDFIDRCCRAAVLADRQRAAQATRDDGAAESA